MAKYPLIVLLCFLGAMTPFLAFVPGQTAGFPGRPALYRDGFFRQGFRCRLKLPRVCTPSWTMKNAWGTTFRTSCRHAGRED